MRTRRRGTSLPQRSIWVAGHPPCKGEGVRAYGGHWPTCPTLQPPTTTLRSTPSIQGEDSTNVNQHCSLACLLIPVCRTYLCAPCAKFVTEANDPCSYVYKESQAVRDSDSCVCNLCDQRISQLYFQSFSATTVWHNGSEFP